MGFKKVTEQPSNYRYLEKMTVEEILCSINNEDKTVADAVEKALLQIQRLVNAVADKLLQGGRLFYIGAGTSGRLGILDASEIPPTYGLSYGTVTGIIAGGDAAIFQAVEAAEDDTVQGWKDLQKHLIDQKDFVVGITSSGTTPYVIGALEQCQKHAIATGSISCNPHSPVSGAANFPVEVVVGPEFVTGSTRMKSGTAQKMVLNMLSTSVMVLLGRVEDNRMINMQLSNQKLIERGTKMVMEQLNITQYDKARALLLQYGSVKEAVSAGKLSSNR
jgi:N-acetylmuramic acid 6-phosphate etherase